MRILFGVGIGFDKDGKALLSADVGLLEREALQEVCKAFGGASITHVDGGWINDKGELVIEPGLAITVYVDTRLSAGRVQARNKAQTFARYLRKTFNQQSILLSESDATCTFIED